jgi:hypothetical protein
MLTVLRLSAALALALVTMVGCARRSSAPEPVLDVPAGTSRPERVGTIQFVSDVDRGAVRPVIIAMFHFTTDGVRGADAMVIDGAPGRVMGALADFRLELVDAAGDMLDGYVIPDPRRMIVEQQGWVEVPEMLYPARFRFNGRAAAARVLNPQGKMLARIDVVEPVRKFCRDHPTGPDC